ncbi:MAG: helix-turn-helix domain-containing protein, partial [Pseudomonadota bacterium]
SPARSIFAMAGGGTVLFDEVENLPRRLQQKLAHAIVNRNFSPLGGGDRVKMDARCLFTIQAPGGSDPAKRLLHADLAKLLKRSALFIPPLRERKSDFPLIVRSALDRLAREFGVRNAGIAEDAVKLLQEHHWPGNLRELEGVLFASSVLAGSTRISVRSLAPFLSRPDQAIEGEEQALEGLIEERLGALFRKFGVEHLKDLHPMVLERVERPLFTLVLRQTSGNQVRAAQVLGINRNTLRRKMTEYGIAAALPAQTKLL